MSMFGGHRLLGNSVPAGKLTSAAMIEVLQQRAFIVPLELSGVAAPADAATSLAVANAQAPSASLYAPGLVVAANEATKKYANVGLLAPNGDRIMSANGRPVFGRITSHTGAGPYNYTITVYDDADQDTATPTAAPWTQATMGATVLVELPWRRRISDMDQTDLRTRFVGLNATERDVELIEDVAELYSKAGIVEGVANDYAFNNYVADGDSLKVAIGKLDSALKALADLVASNNSGATNRINELFSKTGIVEGSANDYATNFYVADGDTLKVAIGKLDQESRNQHLRLNALETYQSTTGVRYTNIVPAGAIAAGQLTFTLPAAPKVTGGRTQMVMRVGPLVYTEVDHYTVAGNTITFVNGFEPVAGEKLIVDTMWA